MEDFQKKFDLAGQEPSDIHEFLTFTVERQPFCIWPDDLLEIVEEGEYLPVPNAPIFLRGVINSHGRIVTVIDLNRLMGGGAFKISGPKRIAILNDDQYMVGLVIPSDIEISFYTGKIEEIGASKKMSFFKTYSFGNEEGCHEIEALDMKNIFEFLKEYFRGRAIG